MSVFEKIVVVLIAFALSLAVFAHAMAASVVMENTRTGDVVVLHR
jgi:hypothetical protein